jgi:hypothetical protein
MKLSYCATQLITSELLRGGFEPFELDDAVFQELRMWTAAERGSEERMAPTSRRRGSECGAPTPDLAMC